MNAYTVLKEYLFSEFPFDKENVENFVNAFEPFEAKKNQSLLGIGEVEYKIYFVASGAIRTFFIKDNSEEATRFIAFEGVFINCLSSFLKQEPSLEGLQALEPTRGLVLRREKLLSLLDRNNVAAQLYTKRIEIAFDNNTWRLETLMTKTAKDRYLYILENHPRMVQRLSNKILASYLGITQESLSRLKKTAF